MVGRWATDLESLEAISQDADARDIVLRMAGLAHRGRLDSFIDVVSADRALGPGTKAWVVALAQDEGFLLAAEEYLASCRHLH
jgi:hypothetical protein